MPTTEVAIVYARCRGEALTNVGTAVRARSDRAESLSVQQLVCESDTRHGLSYQTLSRSHCGGREPPDPLDRLSDVQRRLSSVG